jgi:hypothetical protein
MEDALRLVVWAYPNAIGTVHTVLSPKLITFLGIQIPFEDTMLVGYRGALIRHIPMRNGLRRTVLSTFFTNTTKGLHTKGTISVRFEGKICEDFEQPHPGTKLLCD